LAQRPWGPPLRQGLHHSRQTWHLKYSCRLRNPHSFNLMISILAILALTWRLDIMLSRYLSIRAHKNSKMTNLCSHLLLITEITMAIVTKQLCFLTKGNLLNIQSWFHLDLEESLSCLINRVIWSESLGTLIQMRILIPQFKKLTTKL
jgi:hypothetical protein